MKTSISAITDVGKERTNNEDAVCVCSNLDEQLWDLADCDSHMPLGEHGALMIAADGMGGANAGEVASSIAIDTIKKCFSKANIGKISIDEESIKEFIAKTINLSNEAILRHVDADPDSVGLGTTIVMAWLLGEKAYIAWCGDSRCYRFNLNSGLMQLTKDHSYVQSLVDKGDISPEQAFNHPDNNIITRCLGDVNADTAPEFATYNICDGDVLLLCTDGLCGYCKDSLIEKIMYRNSDNTLACRDSLLKIAMDAGGKDNISIVLCAMLSGTQRNRKVSIKGNIKKLLSKF